MKKFFIRTYGCQMNELDSEVMVGMLERRGMERVEDEEAADLLIFNTCWIRDLAARKVMGKVGRMRTKREKEKIIGITGCMANAKKEALFDKLPHINFVLGTNNIHELETVLDEAVAGEQSIRVDDLFKEELAYSDATREGNGVKANVSIIRGCNKFCTYCCVPYTRGPEVSRPVKDIVDECRKLAAQGYKEVQLLGQNVNSYTSEGTLFHDLLYKLDAIEGLERIRFMTSHPVDITRELMEAIRDLPSVCEFVHFPIQAGSDRILKKMHRIYTKGQYLEKVAMLRELVPQVVLGTDIIVGFPTETDEDFEETLQVFKEIDYHVAFLFAYSPRKGTPSTRWKDDVSEEVKQDRLHRLLRLHNQNCVLHRQPMIGKSYEILVEGCAKEPTMVKGRTRCWKKVLLPGDESLVGTLQRVKINSCSHQSLIGELIPQCSGLTMLPTG